jgi:hypothetical protein
LPGRKPRGPGTDAEITRTETGELQTESEITHTEAARAGNGNEDHPYETARAERRR